MLYACSSTLDNRHCISPKINLQLNFYEIFWNYLLLMNSSKIILIISDDMYHYIFNVGYSFDTG